MLSWAWDGQIKLWERPAKDADLQKDPFGLHWVILWECVGKCPVMLDPAHHPGWMLCVGWADMSNPNSLWVWDTDPPAKEGEEQKEDDDVKKKQGFPHKEQKPKQVMRGHKKMVAGLTRQPQTRQSSRPPAPLTATLSDISPLHSFTDSAFPPPRSSPHRSLLLPLGYL